MTKKTTTYNLVQPLVTVESINLENKYCGRHFTRSVKAANPQLQHTVLDQDAARR